MPTYTPAHARVVIIGGGVVGCATAYHLAKAGCKDVVLLEKGKLTSGSTWHAAGAVAQYRANQNLMHLAKYSVDMIPGLEEETGQSAGWKKIGGMRVTSSKERRVEFERIVTRGRTFGMEMAMITPREAKDRFPLIEIDDLDCGIWSPGDGNVGPSDLTQALAKGARLHGANLIEGIAVTGFQISNGRLTAVETDHGLIKCEMAAICAGIWSRQIGEMAGVNIPVQPAYHCYMFTEKVANLPENLPMFRDPDHWHYVRDEVGSLLVGQYDHNPVPFAQDTVPNSFEFHLAQENLDHFLPNFEPLIKRIPVLGKLGIKNWIHGLEAFTEDQNPVVGESPEVDGLFVACGFNAYGVSVGPGFGMALSHWMLHGTPPFDLWATDIRRFSRYHRSKEQVRKRSLEGQSHHYTIHFPHEETTECRPLRRSAIYERLQANGACFGAKSAWERANWFAPKGVEPVDQLTFGRPNWHAYVGEEHQACRNAAAIFDQSSFAKLAVIGKGAVTALQRIFSSDIAKQAGRLTYTQALNDNGGIEGDMVVARLSENEFYVVTGTSLASRDAHWIRRGIWEGENVSVIDVTSSFGVLSVMGPAARDILQPITESDLGGKAFPFGHVREVMIAGAPVRALHMTFVGELGWELHVPSEYMATVYDAIKSAGASHGLRDAGYRAINTLRIEKGYRVWGADITPDYTPFEAGLGFAVSFKKDSKFIGRSALEERFGQPLKRRLVSFMALDDEPIFLGGEAIFRDGEIVGRTTSGAHGYSFGADIALGYVRAKDEALTDEHVSAGTYEIEYATKRVPVKASVRSWYDPENAKVRA